MNGFLVVHTLNTYFVSTVSLLLNGFMIFTILRTRNGELKRYNNIMLQPTLIDICLSIFTFIVSPVLAISSNNIIIIIDPIFKFDYNVNLGLISLWAGVLYYSICTIPISYFYRYRILCQNNTFSMKLHVFCLFTAGVLAIIYGINFCYGICLRTKDNLSLAETLVPWFSNKGKVNAIGIAGIFDYYLYIVIGHSLLLMGASYIIIIWCNWGIYKHIKNHNQTTVYHITVVDIQTQIARASIVQAIIPLITFGIPTLLMTAALIFPINIPEYFSATLGVFLSYVPLSNGLSMLIYVKPYRLFARNLIRKLFQSVLPGNNTMVSRTSAIRAPSKITSQTRY